MENGALLEGGAVFFLIIMFRNKIAPQGGLSYGQPNSSPRGAISAPFFSQCRTTVSKPTEKSSNSIFQLNVIHEFSIFACVVSACNYTCSGFPCGGVTSNDVYYAVDSGTSIF